MKGLLLTALLSLAFAAGANTLYKCTDTTGHTTYTNTRTSARNCSVLSHDNASGSAPAKPRQAVARPTPTDFPRVNNDVQQKRDTDRRHILEQEQAAELRNLDEAKRALAEQEALRAAPDQVRPHRDRIALHERNLEALRREMSNLK